MNYTDARSIHMSVDPLVVAQAHQAVAEARDQALQLGVAAEAHAREQALQYAYQVEANAQSQAMQYACHGKAQAKSHALSVEATAQKQIQQIKDEASRVILEARREAASSQESRDHLSHQLQEESSKVRQVTAALQEKENMLIVTRSQFEEMQHHMHELMNRMREQDLVIQELRAAKANPVQQMFSESVLVGNQEGSSSGEPRYPQTSYDSQLRNQGLQTIPSPSKRASQSSLSIPAIGRIPESVSIATPPHRHPGTELGFVSGLQNMGELRSAPSNAQPGELHVAPPVFVGKGSKERDLNEELRHQVQQLSS